MPTKATFISHRVESDGLYISALSNRGMLPDIEVFVPRGEAELYGWLDPEQDEEDGIETDNLQKQADGIEELLLDAEQRLKPMGSTPGVMISNKIDHPLECVQVALDMLKALKNELGLKTLQLEEA